MVNHCILLVIMVTATGQAELVAPINAPRDRGNPLLAHSSGYLWTVTSSDSMALA